QLALGLVAHGVAPGDRVAVHLGPEDVLDWIVAYAAVHKAGAVAVPTSTRLVARELRYLLDHAEATAALVSAALVDIVDDARVGIPSLTLLGVAPWTDLVDADGAPFQVPIDDHDIADIMY